MTTTTEVQEHPILFNTEMVRAILDGRKTQTRRVIKPQADSYTGDALGQPVIYPVDHNPQVIHGDQPIKCPYGSVGDELWVRETFAFLKKHDKNHRLKYMIIKLCIGQMVR